MVVVPVVVGRVVPVVDVVVPVELVVVGSVTAEKKITTNYRHQNVYQLASRKYQRIVKNLNPTFFFFSVFSWQ